MTRWQVVGALASGAALAGAWCTFAFLESLALRDYLTGVDSDFWAGQAGVVMGWAIGVWIGLLAAAVLGVVPTLVAAAVWAPLQSALGRGRAVSAVSVLVGLVSMAEVSLFLLPVEAREVLWWGGGAGVICALSAWLALRLMMRVLRPTPLPLDEARVMVGAR